jgi:predicted aconitase with swiveling domain
MNDTRDPIFQGRVVFPASLEGEAIVTRKGFNTLASLSGAILSGSDAAVCSDHDNEDLHGQVLTGKILCLPKTTGSTSAGATWYNAARMGLAPKALLFSQRIDSLAAGGLVLAEVWAERGICCVDQLGQEFLETVKTGDRITVEEDGTVVVHPAEKGTS